MSVLHQNVRSLRGCLNQIEVELDRHRPTVFAATEHWLSQEEIEVLGVEDYRLISYTCREAGCHGGAAVYIRERPGVDVSARACSDINELSVTTKIECAAVEVNVQKNIYVIVAIYRLPCSDLDVFLSVIDSILHKKIADSSTFILAGDFNINMLENSRAREQFTDLVSAYGFKVCFREPMRVTERSGMCIDNFIDEGDTDCYITMVLTIFVS